ncbi:uncharacterized protein VTP21DRAFT_4857 [Calcarisporiella thermophila]|uniref:uncharacterized protein n=1 Tax=Calcarisporiella thermophila TaxID=911321 RepID=UPI00374289CB
MNWDLSNCGSATFCSEGRQLLSQVSSRLRLSRVPPNPPAATQPAQPSQPSQPPLPTQAPMHRSDAPAIVPPPPPLPSISSTLVSAPVELTPSPTLPVPIPSASNAALGTGARHAVRLPPNPRARSRISASFPPQSPPAPVHSYFSFPPPIVEGEEEDFVDIRHETLPNRHTALQEAGGVLELTSYDELIVNGVHIS